MTPAIFFDKDGTLIEDVPYNVDPARIAIVPGAAATARAFHDAGYRIVVITNQSGVARGLFAEDALPAVEARLRELLEVPVAGFYYCPHHPDGTIAPFATACTCRKPQPGLLHRAAQELDLDLTASWMIGDILDDIEAGNRAGCCTVLIDNGNETEWRDSPFRRPDHCVPRLADAVAPILSRQREMA